MEGQEKVSSSTVQFKNEIENSESTKIEKNQIPKVPKPKCGCGRMHRIARPLRAVELLVLAALFALTIFHIVKETEKTNTDVTLVLLIALFITYLFILGADMVSQIIGGTLPDTPMFLFVVLGFLLFAAAAEGVYVLLYLKSLNGFLLAIVILCIIMAIFFLLDIVFIILNWRQICMRIDKCPFGVPINSGTTIYKPIDNYSQRTVRISDPFILRDGVRDVTTSVSNYERPSHPDLVNLHKYRKVGVGRRREYVDQPVNAPSTVCVKVIEVQTEPTRQKSVSDVASLVVTEVEEKPVQTMPKCPVCANHWNPQRNQKLDNLGLCPTFIHLAQTFGMCNCSHSVSPSAPAESILTEAGAESVSNEVNYRSSISKNG